VVTNVLGLVAAVLANAFYWWLDPTGAILLAIYTIVNWSGTVMENAGKFVFRCCRIVRHIYSQDIHHIYFHIVSLIGQSAPPEVLQKLTYLVMRQGGDNIKHVDTVRAYTFGVLYFVEVRLYVHTY